METYITIIEAYWQHISQLLAQTKQNEKCSRMVGRKKKKTSTLISLFALPSPT